MTKKKIERLDIEEGAFRRTNQGILAMKVNELIDSHNDSVEEEIGNKPYNRGNPKEMWCLDCPVHCQSTTPEKKCCEKCYSTFENPYTVGCINTECLCHQGESEKSEERHSYNVSSNTQEHISVIKSTAPISIYGCPHISPCDCGDN